MSQSQRDQRDNQFAQAGNVESLSLTNFMCHAALEIKFCPGVNFVVGENGSGKSAILTGLCVALGARASKTNRSESGNKGLVKTGANIAKVVVRMRNQGAEAYRPEDFGPTVVIERTISATTGASTLKMKSSTGREVGNKRVDLQRLLDHFNIDVDNPINVMTQDASRRFLHSGTDKDRYQFFVKAMLLQDIQDSLAYMKDHVNSMDNVIDAKKAEVPALEQKHKALEEEMSLFTELDTQRQRAEGLKKKLAWALAEEAEERAAAKEAALADLRERKLTKVDEVIAKARRELEAAEAEKAERTKAVAEFNAASTATAEERKAAALAATKARKAEEEVRRLAAETQRTRDDLRRKAQRLADAMESARQTQAQETQVETSAADEVIERARTALARAKEAAERAREEEKAAAAAAARARAARDAGATEDEDITRDEQQTRETLARLQSSQRNGLAAFGDKMPLLVKAVADNARRFSAPPLGPVGAFLRLSDAKWGLVVEEALSNMLTQFLVATPADGRVLQELAAKVGIPRQGVIATNGLAAAAVYDIGAARLPDASLTTLMHVLSSERAAVMNALIDQAHIEAVVLSDDAELCKRVAFGKRQADPLSRNAAEAFSSDGTKRWLKGTSEFTLARQRGGVARLGADVSAQLAAAQAAAGELRQRRTAADARRREADAAVRAADEQAQQAKRRAARVASEAQAAKQDVDEALAAKAHLAAAAAGAGAAVDEADEFEKQLGELAEEEAMLEKSLLDTQSRLDGVAAAARAAKAAAAVKDGVARDALEQNKELTEQLSAALAQVDKVRRELDHYGTIRAQLLGHQQQQEADAAAARKEAADHAAKAAQFCAREEADAVVLPSKASADGSPPGAERLTALLRQVEARMAKEAARHKRPFEDVQVDLTEAAREVKRVKRHLERMSEPASRLRDMYGTRHHLLRRTARELSQIVSHRFNAHMSQRGHAGRLVVDYTAGEMTLEVQLANTAPGSNGGSVTVRDTKQLSGGERSYTTLSFTLSLNESSDSPFCALDEWDVFMDAVARKVSLDKMMTYAAENRQKQFILITPQDISSVQTSDTVTIQKLKPARPGA